MAKLHVFGVECGSDGHDCGLFDGLGERRVLGVQLSELSELWRSIEGIKFAGSFIISAD